MKCWLHRLQVNAVAFTPSGALLASASADKSIRLWDPRSGQGVGELRGHDAGVTCLTFSPDGLLLASGGADETVCTLQA